jgi:hypothetical protein
MRVADGAIVVALRFVRWWSGMRCERPHLHTEPARYPALSSGAANPHRGNRPCG